MPFIQELGGPAVVELRPRLCNRFYEPLVLLIAATQACMHNLAPKVPDQHFDRANMVPKQIFHDYLNKLAQICDNKPYGTTVTAVAVLVYPDKVQYRFASNQRNAQEQTRLKAFVEDILNDLQGWTMKKDRSQREEVRLRVLRKVVAFNRPRLQKYVKALAEHSKQCLSASVSSLTPEIVEKLKEVSKLAWDTNDKNLDEGTFFVNTYTLTNTIRRFSRSSSYLVLRDKANAAQKAGNSGQPNHWSELRHAAGRLQSYHEGIEAFIEARSQPDWDRLFYDFEVVILPSSKPIGHPIHRKNDGAAGIINRMFPPDESDTLAEMQKYAAEMQQFSLDTHIREQNQSSSFRPIVHAELLVHESIVKGREAGDGGIDPLHTARFFEGYRYIGASKPTCRLCDYYLRATGDAIEMRRTHRNLYANWRAPDVLKGPHQAAAEKRRENLLNMVVKWLRKDAQRVLADKVAERKVHDSNTSRTYQRAFSAEYSSRAGGTVYEEDEDEVKDEDEDEDEDGGADLASVMGQLDLDEGGFQ